MRDAFSAIAVQTAPWLERRVPEVVSDADTSATFAARPDAKCAREDDEK